MNQFYMNLDKRHILILTSGGPVMVGSPPRGGIFMYNQGLLLSKFFKKVNFLSTGFFSLNRILNTKKYPDKELIQNLTIIRSYKQMFFIQRYLPIKFLIKVHVRQAMKHFKKYIKDNGLPDIIYSHNIFYSGFVASEIKKKYNIPYLILDHSSAFFNFYNIKHINFIKERINLRSIYAVSSNHSMLLESILNSKVNVIPNVLTSKIFDKSNCQIEKINSKYIFIVIARLHSIKKIDEILKSIANLSELTSNFELRIVGQGSELSRLKSLIKKFNINKFVKFLGHVSQKKIKELLDESNCLILNSKYETFGVVLLEALYTGTPVISSKVGVAVDVINNNNGILVNDQKSLNDSLIFMYKNSRKLFSRKKIIQDICSKYNDHNFIKIFTKELDKL